MAHNQSKFVSTASGLAAAGLATKIGELGSAASVRSRPLKRGSKCWRRRTYERGPLLMSYDHYARPNKLIGLDPEVSTKYDSLKKWEYIAEQLARELEEAKARIKELEAAK